MAQLKDLIVTGATRLIGDVFANKVLITSLVDSAGSTGTNGQVLKSNENNIVWGSLTAANVGAPTTTGTGATGNWNISISGNAATATKATQDGSGNVITSTYVKKTGDTMSGSLTIASTAPHLYLKNTGWIKGTNPTSLTWSAIEFTTNSGEGNKNRISLIETTVDTSGNSKVNFYLLPYVADSTSWSGISLTKTPENVLNILLLGTTTVTGTVKPATTDTYTLGTSGLKWQNVYATTFTGNLSGNASSASTISLTETTPASDNSTSYYLTYATGKSGNLTLRANSDLYYWDTGTTSYLNIGSSSNSGGLTLHNANGKLGNIVPSAFTTNRTFTLPDMTGTIALTSDLDHIKHIQLTDEDLDTINPDDVTYYFASGGNHCTSLPTGVTSFGMVVYRIATGYKIQELTSSGGVVWRRIYDGTAKDWKSWHRGNDAVKQNAIVNVSSYSNWRPLIIGAFSSATEGFSLNADNTITDEVYAADTLTVLPSTGTIRAKNFKTISGNFTANNTGYGLYLKDSAGTSYAGIYDNGTNLWIGASSSDGNHHKGKTYLSTGYNSDGTTGNLTAYISIPTKSGTTVTQTARAIAHVVTAGSTTKPVYADSNGALKPITSYEGNAASATNANLTSTANAVAYYTNTTGKFGSKASENGALYATSTDGALTFGTLPIALGGTGKTTALAAANNLLVPYIGALGVEISANTDLNTYNQTNNKLGTYYSIDSTRSDKLTNTPFKTSGFKLWAIGGYGTTRGHQIVWGTTSTPYLRTETGTDGTFTNWAKLVYNDKGVAVGGTSTPIYVTANGETKEITSVDTAHGGTGNTTYTANRLVYSESATKLSSAASLYATGTALAVNSTSITSGFNFQATGKSILNNTTASSATNLSSLLVVSNTNGGNVALELWRASNASWQLANESGTLYLRNNFTSAKQTTYTQTSLAMDYNTGNAAFAGSLSVGLTTRNTSYKLYVNGTANITTSALIKNISISENTISSNSTFYINRATSASIIFLQNNENKVWIDSNNAFRPQDHNDLSIGITSKAWKNVFLSTQAGANSNGLQFTDGTNIKARIGGNASGELGIYGSGTNIYIRPSLTAADVGLLIKNDKTVVPGGTNTHSLGTNSIRWKEVQTRTVNSLITGTGVAAKDNGSGDNRYVPAKWTFNTGANATNGDVYTIKTPCAGHSYGVFMSVNNGTNYYPVVCGNDLTGRLTTHYPNGQMIQVIFDSSGSAASIYPLAGGTARVTVSGGVFRVINYHNTDISYGATLPTSGKEGQIFLQTSAEYYELPTGGTTGLILAKSSNADRAVLWVNSISVSPSSAKFYPAGSTAATTNSNSQVFNTAIYVQNNVLFGAAWNDYAEYRESLDNINILSGRCVVENGDDTIRVSINRMEPGASIVSDTYGFAIGKTETANLPIAVSGRVLAYPYEDREEFKKNIGKPVCSGPNGTVSIMTDEEYRNYGYCAIGTISSVPNYETWGENNVKVNNRVWIKVR